MEQISVIVPTRNRPESLERCLAAIPRLPWVNVLLGCDGDDGPVPLRADYVLRLENHVGSMNVCNLLAPMADDGLMLLCDDMYCLPGFWEKVLSRFNEAFPDDDGVMGIHQEGISSYAPTGVCLMGKEFLARYPRKQVFNPAYGHFGDVEIYELAHKLGRYAFGGKEIAVFHDHKTDQTHHDGRKHKTDDAKLRRERREAGEVWGL